MRDKYDILKIQYVVKSFKVEYQQEGFYAHYDSAMKLWWVVIEDYELYQSEHFKDFTKLLRLDINDVKFVCIYRYQPILKQKFTVR